MSDASSFETLLEYLKTTRGFDFTGYKRSSLERRITKRMQEVGVDDFGRYLDHLEVHPDEFAYLFNTILINVTALFRDPATWEHVREHVIPTLLTALPTEAPIRVWCAGCASGEETYTLAILLAEALGIDGFLDRVKIYATDVDEEALSEARAATYPEKAFADVPDVLRDRYFERVEQRWCFRKDLRRVIIFGRNDLVQDAPISRVDLLSCRNTLMYFNAETQGRILGRLHFALNPHGFLLLGRSEMLVSHADKFRPDSVPARTFSKVASGTRDRLTLNPVTAVPPDAGGLLERAALEHGPVAQVVVDRAGRLASANRHARTLFALAGDDAGRELKDLELSYRPVDLRSGLDRAYTDRRPIVIAGVAWGTPGPTQRSLDVEIAPLEAGDAGLIGASITFTDVTDRRRLRDDLAASRHELETAYEELQSTVEELETTNEELQSTNEELETTNEELQSTNEELETMNEELQSTNEELETMNDELRDRSLELDEVNIFLETILTSLGIAIVVIDADMKVRVWNRHSVEMWGLRSDEAEGEHLMNLDFGLPVEELRAGLRRLLAGDVDRYDMQVAATDRKGRALDIKADLLPLKSPAGVTGAIVLLEPTAA